MAEKTNKKILVTGSTGYVGQRLVAALAQSGADIYALSRSESSLFTQYANVRVVQGDVTEPITIPDVVGVIYHCAGVISDSHQMDKVNVEGTQNIVNLAIKNNSKLIYLSSAGIVGKTEAKIIDEDTPCRPHNAYEISKLNAENLVMTATQRGLSAQILRPATIFGQDKVRPEIESFFQLIKSMRTGLYRNIGEGVCNIVHIDEVVKALLLLDETEKAPDSYILSNHISYRDLDILVKNLNPRMKKKSQTIPYFVGHTIALGFGIISTVFNKKNPLTFSRLRALTNKSIYSQKKIENHLSFKNIRTVEESITKTFQAYIDAGLLP